LGDHVVDAFDVLHVDRGVDVDAGGQQFAHVLPTLGVAAEALGQAAGWWQVHAAFARYGLEIKPHGNGLVLRTATANMPSKPVH